MIIISLHLHSLLLKLLLGISDKQLIISLLNAHFMSFFLKKSIYSLSIFAILQDCAILFLSRQNKLSLCTAIFYFKVHIIHVLKEN